MADYIKREDAVKAAIEAADEWDGGYITPRVELIEKYLDDIPAADVRENVKGIWIGKQIEAIYACRICSKCKAVTPVHYFCGNCGADMRGEK